jgi:hypothetical protein
MFFYFFKGDGNPVYSPEFARGGLTGLFALNILQILNSPTVTVTIEGRSDDSTAWATVGTYASITTAGVKTLNQGSLTQVLRYKFEAAGSSDTSGVCIQLYSPQWRD